jgi:putative ABC transport system permease protein
MQGFWKDVFYGLRTARQNPVFSITAVLILAIAIGGNTAMFSVIRTVLLKPLSYSDPDRLVRVSGGATPARFDEMRDGARSFSGLAAFTIEESVALAGQNEPEVLAGARVSANFLEILGVQPALGRSFVAAEDSREDAPVALISSELWQRVFGGDSKIAGKTVTLGARPYTIIGVLPPHFDFPYAGLDVWLTSPTEWPMMAAKSRALSPFLTIFGRLKTDVSLEQANAELTVLQRQYLTAHPSMLDAKPKAPPRVVPLKEELVAKIRAMLWMLFGAVGLVLLIACANLAGLVLARATSRSREFAVRAALGAERIRLIRQLLAENLLLALGGGVLGVAMAAWIFRAIRVMDVISLPRAGELNVDWVMLLVAATLSIGTGVLFGLVPSLSASRPDLISILRGPGDAANYSSSVFGARSLLVVGQVALSVILLIGAGLMMRSVIQLHRVDVGFNPANVLTAGISWPLPRYAADQKKAWFMNELLRRVGSLPGVDSAGGAMFLPMAGFVGSPVQDAAKPPLKLNERTIATLLIVTPNYFRTLRVPVRRGRDFAERDSAQTQRVAIIDDACARHFWPDYPNGQDPVGQHLLIGGIDPHPAEIIGVVASVHQNLENTEWPNTVYVPFAQNAQSFAMLAVRTHGDPLVFARAVREQVRAIDPDQPISKVRTMEELIDEEIGERNLILTLLGSFGGVALLLTLTGIYGIAAYSVVRRTHEVGIRRALGAQAGDILRLIVTETFVLSLAGVLLGLGGAMALTGALRHYVFQLSTSDPGTFLGISALFILVAFCASYVPAWRATRIDPIRALRVE